MIAALFVQRGGVYFGLPDVDPWDEQRDARLYAGPLPVVAHPPCQRWGRYWFGGPSAKVRVSAGALRWVCVGSSMPGITRLRNVGQLERQARCAGAGA